jgi:hypothetical protein
MSSEVALELALVALELALAALELALAALERVLASPAEHSQQPVLLLRLPRK